MSVLGQWIGRWAGSWFGGLAGEEQQPQQQPAGADARRRKRVVLWGRTYKLGRDGVYRELESEVRRRVRRALAIAPGEATGRLEVVGAVERAAEPVRREFERRAPDLLPLLMAIVDEIEREEDEDLSLLLMAG